VSAPIYLDYQATTPVAPEVAAAMQPWIEEKFANPHSPHKLGREAAAAVEVARDEVVETIYYRMPESDRLPDWADKKDAGNLYFTSGATEALNWAIKGTYAQAGPDRRRVVAVATDHAAVLDTMNWLGSLGAEVVVLPVKRDGRIDHLIAPDLIDERTALVAMLYINNEIGVIQHTGLIHLAERARKVGARVICDCVQGFGKMTLPVGLCDMIAISSHKIHGPKGIGALWVRKGHEPAPLMHGGGQEGDLRSGTLSPALCVGFGAAAKLAREFVRRDHHHVEELYQRLRQGLGDEWHVNGSRSQRWRGNLNAWRAGVDASRLISELRGLAFSAGSACASGSGRPSHVLEAIGLTDAQARSSIRLGFGRYTTPEEVDAAVEMIDAAVARQLQFA